MKMSVLVIVEHNNNELLPATLHTVNAAKQIGNTDALVIGNNCQTVIKSTSKIEGINEVLLCDEEIYKKAKRKNDEVQIIKCFFYLSKFEQVFDEKAQDEVWGKDDSVLIFEHIGFNKLSQKIDQNERKGSLASALRVFILESLIEMKK